MNRIKYIIPIMLVAFCACSESDEVGPVQPEQELHEVDYSLATRSDVFPSTGDTYSFISTTSDKSKNPIIIRNDNWRGYYAYDANQTMLVPVENKSDWPHQYPADDIIRNNSAGQKLGTYGSTSTDYYTAIFYPGIPMYTSGTYYNATGITLGLLGVFYRQYNRDKNNKVYVSNPWDRDMQDNNPDDPFKITVERNSTIYTVDAGVKLYPITAAIKVYFYSSTGLDFSINPSGALPRLLDVGANGWYNPFQRLTHINYNNVNYQYHDELVAGANINSYAYAWRRGTSEDKVPGNCDVEYVIDDEPLYAARYKSGNNFNGTGRPYLRTVTLEVTVRNKISSKDSNVTIPLEIDMESGKRYSFYVDVKENVVTVTWDVSWQVESGGWEDGGGGDEEVGGGTLGSFILSGTSPGWEDGGDDNEEVGGISGETFPLGGSPGEWEEGNEEKEESIGG
ncbi:hypothetical protein [Bacteroides reticulotermitis]|uniref:hypothetical protein n=1 Tax=Bacteroides reticulotermitis TaxID=1133319 RepID=UPI003A893AC1